MAGDNPIELEIERAVRGHEHENEEIRQEVQGRVENNRGKNRQEMHIAQGGYLPPHYAQGGVGHAQGGYNQDPYGNAQGGPNQSVAQIEKSEVINKLLERVDMLENAKVVSFQQSPPPLFEDLNPCMSQIPPPMEEVNFMSRQGYQGPQGNYGQGRQERYNPPNYQSGQGNQAYNPNQRKHDPFSYANPKTVIPFPPGFEPGAKPPNNEGKLSTDEMLSLIYKEIKEKDAKVDEYMKSTSNQIKNMEYQMGQLATTLSNSEVARVIKGLQHQMNMKKKKKRT
ncbi:hypothetical protein ACS0TY_006201 [Phlomoides rotata]